MSEINEQYIEKKKNAAESAYAELLIAVAQNCEGVHRPVQHRDGKRPWCNSCGRTNEGDLIGKTR